MNVLLINGSPHERGCTFTALSEAAKTLNENGVDTEIVQVGHLDVRGCVGCQKCRTSGKCVFDDAVNEMAARLPAIDGMIIGSPVYFAAPAGALVSFLNRLFYSTLSVDKTMKVGAAVVSARRAGTTAAFDALNKYFTLSGMPVASSRYWNMVHGNTPGEALQDAEGLATMRTLGRNMAFLIKSIALGKERCGLPANPEPPVKTNFIRAA